MKSAGSEAAMLTARPSVRFLAPGAGSIRGMWRHTLAEGCAREKVIADFAIKSSNGAYFACDVIQINGGAAGSGAGDLCADAGPVSAPWASSPAAAARPLP